jgi:hypothetical protein
MDDAPKCTLTKSKSSKVLRTAGCTFLALDRGVMRVYAVWGDAQVYDSDLKLMEPPNWINDNLLAFGLE